MLVVEFFMAEITLKICIQKVLHQRIAICDIRTFMEIYAACPKIQKIKVLPSNVDNCTTTHKPSDYPEKRLLTLHT